MDATVLGTALAGCIFQWQLAFSLLHGPLWRYCTGSRDRLSERGLRQAQAIEPHLPKEDETGDETHALTTAMQGHATAMQGGLTAS